MKKIILSLALLSAPLMVSANQFSPFNSNGFNMPNWGNGNNRFNNNGSNWNMPNMNWGNNNGGSNWNMPNMNWGNGYNSGSNWNMPNMNWGNNNGGSNWNMPNMNWGNNGSGSNWNIPNMNWGNNQNTRPWNFGNSGYNNRYYGANPNYRFAPRPAYKAPTPKFKPKGAVATPKMTTQAVTQNVKPAIVKPTINAVKDVVTTVADKIPTPNDVKGVVLAPANQPTKAAAEIIAPAVK